MKRQILLLGVLLAVVSVLTFGGLASAHSFRTGNTVTTGAKEKINHTLFAAGSTVDIGSEVDGDVFCAGQTVNISGVVHGDVICAGQTVTVSGTVDGDVRLAGQSVTLGAKVAGNATIGGQTFVLTSGGSVGRDLSVGSTGVTIDGNVGRDVAFGSDVATFDSEIGRDIVGTVNNLNLGDRAQIRGNIKYTSANGLHKSAGTVIDGTISRSLPPKHESKRGAVFGFSIVWFLYWLSALVLLTFMLALAFPRVLDRAVRAGLPWPWKPLVVGLVASIVVPICFIFAAVTVIGLPIALIILLTWILIEIVGIAFSGYYLGRVLLRHSTWPLLIALTGSAALAVLMFIPFVGILVLVVAAWIGEGLVLLAVRNHLQKPIYNLAPKSVPVRKVQ